MLILIKKKISCIFNFENNFNTYKKWLVSVNVGFSGNSRLIFIPNCLWSRFSVCVETRNFVLVLTTEFQFCFYFFYFLFLWKKTDRGSLSLVSMNYSTQHLFPETSLLLSHILLSFSVRLTGLLLLSLWFSLLLLVLF